MSIDERALGTVLVIAALGVVPFFLMISTSFVKAHVVLALLRSALGTGEVPSTGVLTAFAALLAVIVMQPVASQMAEAASAPLVKVDAAAPLGAPSRGAWMAGLEAASVPLAGFLKRNAGAREQSLFLELSRRGRPSASASDLLVVLPAFLITELAEALQMGFVLLLPFLVVDLVAASVLTSLGMTSLLPSAVALPLKLLLFLSVDGFGLLSRALVSGYR